MIKHKQSKQAQIRRKIVQSGIAKPEQYEEIISNLINQRERLENDLKLLREKVVALQMKEAQKQASRNLRKRPSAAKQDVNYREELQKKYEELRLWQKRSLKAMKNSTVQIEYRTFLNKLFSVDQQIQTALRQLNDEYVINKRLRKGLKILDKDDKKSNNVQNGIQQENQILKKRIFSLKKYTENHLSKEIELQNQLIDAKEKMRENRAKDRELVSRNRRSSKDSRNLREMARIKTEEVRSSKADDYSVESEEIVDLDIHLSQVMSKDQVFQIEGRLNRMENKWRSQVSEIEERLGKNYPAELLNEKRDKSKLTFAKQLELLLERVKANLKNLNQLNQSKVNLLLLIGQQNTFESQKRSESSMLTNQKRDDLFYKKHTTEVYISERQQSSPMKRSRIRSVTLGDEFKQPWQCKIAGVDEISQTQCIQYYDELNLRREFVGSIEENCIFDCNILKQYENPSIKALHIYYTDRGIATILATYNIHAKETTKERELFLPDSFIKNYCKVYVIDTQSDDFIRYFKVRYHLHENRITQVKIVTNRNIKNGWGDAKIKGQEQVERDEEIQKDFVFDINQDEYPVSIFCSHVQKGPYWYLCGFGVEINDL